MSTFHGEAFLVLKPSNVVFGINSFNKETVEIVNFASQSTSSTQCENISCEKSGEQNLAIIACKSISLKFGGESGANENNVTIGLTYVENESDNGILATDLVRLGLERGVSAEKALDVIVSLIEGRATSDSQKYCFVICDNQEAWILNAVGNMWAAEKITEGCRSVATGLSIGSKIDKQCDNLQEKTKELGLWDGSTDFNFTKAFSGEAISEQPWVDSEDQADFDVIKMFQVLRRSTDVKNVQTSQVSILTSTGMSNHWFTATPDTQESVFKPFVFTPNARISSLTKAGDSSDKTPLNKLHENRNWGAIGDLLQSLEKSCVEEVKTYLLDHSGVATQELDELMKDCVEAEVKFYR